MYILFSLNTSGEKYFETDWKFVDYFELQMPIINDNLRLCV